MLTWLNFQRRKFEIFGNFRGGLNQKRFLKDALKRNIKIWQSENNSKSIIEIFSLVIEMSHNQVCISRVDSRVEYYQFIKHECYYSIACFQLFAIMKINVRLESSRTCSCLSCITSKQKVSSPIKGRTPGFPFIRKLTIFGEHPVVFRCAHPIGYGLIFGKDTRKSSEFIFVRPSPRIRKDWKVFLARGSFELQKKLKILNRYRR